MMRRMHVVLLIVLFGSFSVQAAETRRDDFGDWGFVCSKAEEAGSRESCNLFQTALLNAGQDGDESQPQRLLLTRIGYLGETERPLLLVTAPLGILLPQGISVTVGEGEPVRFAVQRCDAGGCLGFTAMTDELLEAFRKGSKAQVTFHDAQRRAINVPLSLKGFIKGMAELKASRKN